MSGLPFVVVVAVVLSLGPQTPSPSGQKPGPKPSGPQPSGPQPQPSKNKGKTVPVEIIVGELGKLQDLCKGGKPINTIYVATPSKTVYHCIGTNLINHAEHGKNPNLAKADVLLNDGDSVRWYTQTTPVTFFVQSIVKSKEAPISGAAPDYPFSVPFVNKPAESHTSAPVWFINGKTQQRYKVTFNITGLGAVDPDLICTM